MRTPWLPVATGVALAVVAVAGSLLYVDSTGSAAVQQQLADGCPADVALRLPIDKYDRDAVEEVLVGATEPRRNTYLGAQPKVDGVTQRVLLVAVDEAQGSLGVQPLVGGEAALSRANLRRLELAVGDSIELGDGTTLEVAEEFDDLSGDAVPRAWCGWANLFDPRPSGDPPPLSAVVSAVSLDDLDALAFDEFLVADETPTLPALRQTLQSFDLVADQVNAETTDFRERVDVSGLRAVVNQADTVQRSVQRGVLPTLMTALVFLAVVQAVFAVLLARSRHDELRLLAIRGGNVATLSRRLLTSVIAAVVVGVVLGLVGAVILTRYLAPSPVIARSAYVQAAVAAVLVALASAVWTLWCASMSELSQVDASHRNRAATGTPAVVAGTLVIVSVLAYWSLRRDGGLQFAGVNSFGGGLLGVAFPLVALLTAGALGALGSWWACRRLRRSGAGLPRGYRIGWRRVTTEPTISCALVLCFAVSLGSVLTSVSLANGTRVALTDKAEAFVGAEYSVSVFDEIEVPASLRSDATVMTTRTGTLDGDTVTLISVDADAFGQVAGWRDDASDSSLDELLQRLAPGATPSPDGSVPVLAVASDRKEGDRTTIEASDGTQLDVVVTGTSEWFPRFARDSAKDLFVVDQRAIEALQTRGAQTLLFNSDAVPFVDQLRSSGTRLGALFAADRVFEQASFDALRWTYAPLRALGLMLAVLAVAVAAASVVARAPRRRAVFTLTRRMGFTRRNLVESGAVELGVPVAIGSALGAVAAYIVGALALPNLDPLRAAEPPALPYFPTSALVWLLAAAAVGVVVAAVLSALATVGGEPMAALSAEEWQ